MADPLEVAAEHQARQEALARAAAAAVRGAWREVDSADLTASWARVLARVLAALVAAQRTAAGDADDYVTRALAAQGLHLASAGDVDADQLAGVASDGRNLASLLTGPVVVAKEAIGTGSSVGRALAAGESALDMIAQTQVADAGRAAEQVAITARPRVGFVRMVSAPCCSRCAILAGRWYRYNAGFARHPRCLPAGVVVSGPATAAATRRWYQGELVVVTTASGQRLPITGNHPVLADRGWLPAHLLQEGDHVVHRSGGQRAVPLVVPDEHQVPTLIEDVWRAGAVVPFGQVPTTAEDFHGDGGHGDVDVVLPDRLLRSCVHASAGQLAQQEQLALRIAEAALLAEYGSFHQLLMWLLSAAYGSVGGGRLSAALVGSHASSAYPLSGAPVADLDAGLLQMPADGIAVDAISGAQAQLAFASVVGSGELVARQDDLGARWDPPSGPLTAENRGAYAGRGLDLLRRLAGQVELDRVVECVRVSWSGHVYNLTSAEGWYEANGVIVSNCHCRAIPAAEDAAGALTTSPSELFGRGQITDLSAADRRAVELGSDLARVVNACRGMYVAGGRKFTTEAAVGVRLMPEQILAAAASREDAVRLLRKYGYIR